MCLACVEALKIIALAASPMRSSEHDNEGTNTCEICFPKISYFNGNAASAGTLRQGSV